VKANHNGPVVGAGLPGLILAGLPDDKCKQMMLPSGEAKRKGSDACSRAHSHRRCRFTWADRCVRWPSRLVATAQEDRLRLPAHVAILNYTALAIGIEGDVRET
jgi:hypothetical protein